MRTMDNARGPTAGSPTLDEVARAAGVSRATASRAVNGGTKVSEHAQRAVDDAFLDGWRAATASGPQAQRMFVAGMTLKQGPKVAKQVAGVHDRLTPPPAGNSEEKGGRSTYP